jgi:hypothetical protein
MIPDMLSLRKVTSFGRVKLFYEPRCPSQLWAFQGLPVLSNKVILTSSWEPNTLTVTFIAADMEDDNESVLVAMMR